MRLPPQVSPTAPRRPLWVLVIAGVYALLLGSVLLLPVLWYWDEGPSDSNWDVIKFAVIWLGILLFCQAALLFVPVQVARRRAITRRSLWVPVGITGLLVGILVLVGGFAVAEWWRFNDDMIAWAIVAAAVSSWIGWAVLFYWLGLAQGTNTVALRVHRWLLAGSVLELLVAIPAHLIVRRRPVCCAGIYTGTAIAMGVVIMVLAFGPSVALLFVRRWKKITPRSDVGHGFEVITQRETAGDLPLSAKGEAP